MSIADSNIITQANTSVGFTLDTSASLCIPPLALSFITQDSRPNYVSTGYINAIVTGGVPPYTYYRAPGYPITEDWFNMFGAQTVNLTVTDSIGNTVTGTASISTCSPIIISSTKSGLLSLGNATGNSNVIGVYPATIKFDDGNIYTVNSSSFVSNPQNYAGFQIITTIDDCGNTSNINSPPHTLANFPVGTPISTPPSAMESWVKTTLDYRGINTTYVSASRAFPPGTPSSTTSKYTYTYLWSNGSTSFSLNNVPSGTYTCLVTALFNGVPTGETNTLSITIPPNTIKTLTVTPIHTTLGLNNGDIVVNTTNTYLPLRVVITQPGKIYDAGSLPPGTYTVRVYDFVGDALTQNITIL